MSKINISSRLYQPNCWNSNDKIYELKWPRKTNTRFYTNKKHVKCGRINIKILVRLLLHFFCFCVCFVVHTIGTSMPVSYEGGIVVMFGFL